MRIGFIGAGKMGFTLGKYLVEAAKEPKGRAVEYTVVGYYSRSAESAKEAAEFTDTKYYDKIDELVRECDTIFITVPDGQISVIADVLSERMDLMEEKIVCHTSGALSSQVFSGMDGHVYGYSIHPIYAVNSKTESYINFGESFITIEGHEKYLQNMKQLFIDLGQKVAIIGKEDKVKYHSAAVFASNLVVGLYHMASGLLTQCGFDEEMASSALKPLFLNNAINISKKDDLRSALTGPLERGDAKTIKEHMAVLEGNELEVYRLLSKELLKVVDCDLDNKYDEIKKIV